MNSATGNDAFSNQAVSADALPSVTTLDFQALSPAYRKLNLSVAALVSLVVIGAVVALGLQSLFPLAAELRQLYPYIVAGLMVLALAWLGYHLLADKRIGYALREQDVSLKRGLIFRKIVCQPILRVQHVQVKRGPLERLAGLATLQVFSAGGAMHTFEVPGLSFDRAQQLRQFILDHKDLSAR